jgi:hypothetical protein
MKTQRTQNLMFAAALACALIATVIVGTGFAQAQAPPFKKAHVADRIRKVENGVDEFRKYADRRAEDANNRADTAKSSGRTARRGRANTAGGEASKERAKNTKDELDDALGGLNRSTNRLRRKFDPTDTWMETKVQMQRVMDDARRVNQVMVRGKYGTQAERYWAALRASINDLARCYGIIPMGV